MYYACRMRLTSLSFALFIALTAFASEPLGRYQGVAIDKKPDGTRGAQVSLFMIFRREGAQTVCTGGTDSFNDQIPCEGVVVNGSGVKFGMPFGGGVVFDLKASGDVLAGTLHSKPGIPTAPFNTVELRRTGDLTLSDQVPRLDWESSDRSPLLLQLRKRVAEGQSAALAEFWTSIEKSGTPILETIVGTEESVLTTFVWRGRPETKNVLLLWPRLSYARPDDYFFSKIPGTDVWFKTLKVRRGMRIYYQVSPDDPLGQRPEGKWPRKSQADPLNPKRDNPDRSVPPESIRSLLELPGALPQPWYAKRSDVLRYSLVEKEISSKQLASTRKVLVYTPPGFSAQHEPYPSIYLTDGEDPDGLVFATWTFENLLAGGEIPPTVVIRIVNPDQETRNRELACNTPFADYLNDELVPFIRKNFNTSVEPSKTAIGGYSLGGLGASYAGFRHPETFGLILSQSGAYWFEPTHKDYAEPNWLARQFAERDKLQLRFYMDAGTNELDMTGRGGGILVTNRQFRDILRAKGYEVQYQEFAGDHDYINWRGTLADGLIVLFGDQTKLGLLSTSRPK